ncbi:hypothetical protein LPJ64_006288 [Coemansia asiatica]|uniref:Uncharacterized protein n=1 Tax=Coemansia asiatica TaxID=1052880 RepID=A0A9W7XCT1_9FUNG|nr:hypothetical protein LPJ64_006288 [Coemansia asiatica]
MALGKSASLDIFGHKRRRRKLPRIPSSKIAVLSGIDLLMHLLWIVNTTAAKTPSSCTATFFFYHWIQLFYLFFLASFVSRSAMRLRNLQPVQPQRQRRTDMVYCASTLAASLVLSLLPAVMYNSDYDHDLGVCWFERGSSIAVRWLWMSLNTWVVISLVFLIATSIYVAIILSNERRDLLSFIAPPLTTSAPATTTAAAPPTTTQTTTRAVAFSAEAAPGVMPKLDLSSANVPKQYYYAGNHQLAVVSSNRMTLVANDNKKRISQANLFGVKSTPLTSRESLAIYPVPSSGDKQESRRLSSYPATHPVALAHEALHGRRPVGAAASTRNSTSICACFVACSSGGAPSLCELCRQGSRRSSSHGSRHNSDILQYGVASCVFGRTAQWATGSNGSNSRCSSSSRSQGHSSSRYSAGNSINVAMGVSRPESMGPDRNHASTKASTHMCAVAAAATASGVGTPSMMALPANDSDSSRICAPQPWDSSRRLLHKHSYGSSITTTPAESVAASDYRPLYGFYAQKPVNRQHPGGQRDEMGNKRRGPKHMSMPVAAHNSVGRRVSVAAAAAAAIQRHNSRRQSVISDDLDRDVHHRHHSSTHNPYGIRYQQQSQQQYQQQLLLRRQLRRNHYSMDPRLLESNMASRNTRMPSIHEDIVRAEDDGDGDDEHCDSADPAMPSLVVPATRSVRMASAYMPEPASEQQQLHPAANSNQKHGSQSKTVTTSPPPAAANLVEDDNGGILSAITGLFSRMRFSAIDRRQKSHGQIQRIERRVHTLVATGALRVATRAMVPLVTQLCMVIWSTMHSLLPEPDSEKDPVIYSVAIILLSLQGIIDMALYFIYDTHSDASEVSLPSSAYPMLASSHHVNTIHAAGATAGGGGYGKSPMGNYYAQTRQPSLLHLHGDIYYGSSYTPRGSQDAYTHHHYNNMHGLRHWGSAVTRQTPNQYQRSNSLTSTNSNGSHLSTSGNYAITGAATTGATGGGGSDGRVNGLTNISVNGTRSASVAIGDPSNLDRRFAFNLESLNIRRVDRTSNAMQSDTLNGSDCMAWSHTDGLSVHDATSSISLFSASGPLHNQSHRPVLNGWEEIELEDIGPSFDYRHQQQQQQHRAAGNWSNSDISRTEL